MQLTFSPILRLVCVALLTGLFRPSCAECQAPVANAPKQIGIEKLSADASTFEGVQVEMNGFERVETTEVSEGLYQLTIWSRTKPCFQAILPYKWAVLAKRSKQLFVSVKNATATPPTLTIYGNALSANNASAAPNFFWAEPLP